MRRRWPAVILTGYYLDFLKLAPMGGHIGISVNKAPTQPEMHFAEIGKLLKTFLGQAVMFHGAFCPADSNQWKDEEGITPSMMGSNTQTGAALPLSLPLGPAGLSCLDSSDSQLYISHMADRAAPLWKLWEAVGVVMVVYVHGWKNSSRREEGEVSVSFRIM